MIKNLQTEIFSTNILCTAYNFISKLLYLLCEEINHHIQFIKKLDFMEVMNSNTKFRNNIIVKLSRELGDRALMVTTLSQKTVKSRLALSLIQLNMK